MWDDAPRGNVRLGLGVERGLERLIGGNVEDRPGLWIIHTQKYNRNRT